MSKADGFTLVELLIVTAILGVLAAIAYASVNRAKLAANEASAISSVRAISDGEAVYAASCGASGYAQNLTDLGTAPAGSVPFIPADLAGGAKTGYNFVLSALNGSATVLPAADTCNGAGADAVDGYHISGVPSTVGVTGQRAFATDNSRTIYQDLSGAAIANPIPAGTQPVN
jgi:type IV pilus assembly protein PilA